MVEITLLNGFLEKPNGEAVKLNAQAMEEKLMQIVQSL